MEFFWSSKRANGEEWAIQSRATPKHIPIAIYGDSARLYTAQRESKYLGIFMSLPLWRPRSTRFSRWCIFSLENAKLFGHHTLHPVLSRITYKLNMLFENGVVGSDGVTYKFACTEIRGDWEWHKQVFNLSSSWKSITNVCFRCKCVARSDDPKKLFYCTDDVTHWNHFGLVDFLASQIEESPSCPFLDNIFFVFPFRPVFSDGLRAYSNINTFFILFGLLTRSFDLAAWVSSPITTDLQYACPKLGVDVWYQWMRFVTQLKVDVAKLCSYFFTDAFYRAYDEN